MTETEIKKSKSGSLESEEELREDMGQRQEIRRTNEQNKQQDLNQGMATGTHSSAHGGIRWGASYRIKSKNEPALPIKERIESRAHQIYLESGGKDGQALEHWLIAEKELKRD
jgi:hypothetical protein